MTYNLRMYMNLRKAKSHAGKKDDWALTIQPIGSPLGMLAAAAVIRWKKRVKEMFLAAVVLNFVLYCCLAAGKLGEPEPLGRPRAVLTVSQRSRRRGQVCPYWRSASVYRSSTNVSQYRS
jgi:hypothetical protein